MAAIPLALLIDDRDRTCCRAVITKARVPSFVVTLAGLPHLVSGVVLILTTEATMSGTIRIQDDRSSASRTTSSPRPGAGSSAPCARSSASPRSQREGTDAAQARSPHEAVRRRSSRRSSLWQPSTFAAVVRERGSRRTGGPLILGVFLLFWTFIATRTRFGRHVYAVGGNPEAARRAGIDVDRVRIAVFMITSFMAGVGGISSRLGSARWTRILAAANLLLIVIAAAVIGGTSLFGGVGRMVSALLGAAVIAPSQNGMDLLDLASGPKFVITGLCSSPRCCRRVREAARAPPRCGLALAAGAALAIWSARRSSRSLRGADGVESGWARPRRQATPAARSPFGTSPQSVGLDFRQGRSVRRASPDPAAMHRRWRLLARLRR